MSENCNETCYKSGKCVTEEFIKRNNVRGYNCHEYQSSMSSSADFGCYVESGGGFCDRSPCIVNDRLKIMGFEDKDIPFCPYQNVMNFA